MMILTPHPSIYYRIDSRGRKTYYLRLYDRGRQTWRAVGPRLEDALRIQAELRIRKAENRLGLSHPVSITFAQLAAEYLKYYNSARSPDNMKRVQSLMGHLIRYFGPLELRSISSWQIEGYVRKRITAGMKARTVNTELDYLRAALRKALEWQFLENEVRIPRLPVQEVGPARDLSTEEVMKILTALSPDQRDATIIALATGLRIGEIYRLAPPDWNREEHIVSIIRTKSGKVREIPLPPWVEDILQRRFAESNVRLFDYSSLERMIALFIYERKKLYPTLGRWRFHDLRHTFGTMLADRGAPAQTIMALLGHASLSMTTRYTHTDRARKRAAIALLLPTNIPSPEKQEKK